LRFIDSRSGSMNAKRLNFRLAVFVLQLPALLAVGLSAVRAEPVVVEMVRVGNPGNAPDTTGYGNVSYEYFIAKHETTIGQYAAFLNAVAAEDLHGLYDPGMQSLVSCAGIQRHGEEGAYTYTVIGPGGSTPPGAASGPNRPIALVTWFDAARFANWMANGQPTGTQNSATTEDGAYTLNGATSGSVSTRNAINPNTGEPPAYFIPLENEWYKAAFYSPDLQGGAGGYYLYATQSDVSPGNVLGSGANQANYIVAATGFFSVTQSPVFTTSQNYLTDVGAFTSNASYYGTFDQNGNVWEWMDLPGSPVTYRILRGGAWTSFADYLESVYRLGSATGSTSSNVGFRLAAPVIQPPPSLVIPMVGVGQPGNAPDLTGYGGVGYAFRIGREPVTIGQYCEFLNAVAATDTYQLYNGRMATDLAVAGIARGGSSGSYVYSVIDPAGVTPVGAASGPNRPITYVSWFDAARFANWMSNGQPRGSQSAATTEDGAYALQGVLSGIAPAKNAINPNTGLPPSYYIPLENEWYKAAYYSPSLNGGAGGYYLYATQSDVRPVNEIGGGFNLANYLGSNGRYAVTQSTAFSASQNYLTDVDAFSGSSSYYGTLGQNGNVYHLNDLNGAASSSRGLRGGFWASGDPPLQAPTFANVSTAREANDAGFVLAAPDQNYTMWAESYGLAGGSALGTSDPDGDGFINDLEFAFGTDPTAFSAVLTSASTDASNLVVSYLMRGTGVTYEVQTKEDLADPSPWSTASVSVVNGSQSPAPADGYVRRQFSVPLGGRAFYRVQISVGP
jgi:formylglycine-generating enzyme